MVVCNRAGVREPSSGVIIGGREVVVNMGSDILATDVKTEAGGIMPRPDSDETGGAIATYRIGRGVVSIEFVRHAWSPNSTCAWYVYQLTNNSTLPNPTQGVARIPPFSPSPTAALIMHLPNLHCDTDPPAQGKPSTLISINCQYSCKGRSPGPEAHA